MNLLALETTCDETAAAILTDRLEVLASVVASQDELHRRFGGVVPEIASRAHLENILPVIDEALRKAGMTLSDIDVVAVANTPGLAGSLLVGLVAAKSICVARGIPLIAVNHLQAHIYACRMALQEPLQGTRPSRGQSHFRCAKIGTVPSRENWDSPQPRKSGQSPTAERNVFPCIGLIVSGGHSSLYRCLGPLDFEPLGGTIDDAAGEAFDKVAAMLGLPYPGGPSIERAAANGNPRAYSFPRPLLNDDRLDFSFSGLKTAVRYAIEKEVRREKGEGTSKQRQKGTEETVEKKRCEDRKTNSDNFLRPPRPALQPPSPSLIADLAASFQEAAVDCLVGKAFAALQRTGMRTLCVGGGVAANSRLRERLKKEAELQQVDLHIAPLRLCTDNAVMGAIAVERWKAGLFEPLDLDVFPGVVRTPVTPL
jgi:N6-L-threonylcarbamoyladenine synthase